MVLESEVSRSECLVASTLDGNVSGEITVDFSSREMSGRISVVLGFNGWQLKACREKADKNFALLD